MKAFDDLPAAVRESIVARLMRVQNRAKGIGWGYGDFVDDVVRTLEARRERGTRSGAVER